MIATIRDYDDFSGLSVLDGVDRGIIQREDRQLQTWLQPAQANQIAAAVAELDVLKKRTHTDQEAMFSVKVYQEALASVPHFALKRAIKEIIKSEEWFPVPSLIIARANIHVGKLLWRRKILGEWLKRKEPPKPQIEQRMTAKEIGEMNELMQRFGIATRYDEHGQPYTPKGE